MGKEKKEVRTLFVQSMCESRGNNKRGDLALAMFELICQFGIEKTPSHEEAQAYLIRLTQEVFGFNSEERDLILASFMLLKGYDGCKTLKEVRMKLLEHYPIKSRKKDGKPRTPEEKSKDFASKETECYGIFEISCQNKISGKIAMEALMEDARKRYLDADGRLAGDLPVPSYMARAADSGAGIKTKALKRTGKINGIGIQLDNHIVGRDAIIKAMENSFRKKRCVLIGGTSGIGKTCLALEYARRHADDYQITCWLNANDERSILNSARKFLKTAGIGEEPLPASRVKELFLDFFEANTGWLIVYDDCRVTEVHSKQLMEDYMPRTSAGHIIITSSVYKKVGQADFYHLDDLVRTENDEDERLFLKEELGLKESDQSSRDLARLCRGDFLGLSLAASYIKQMKNMDSASYFRMLAEEYGAPLDKDFSVPVVCFENLMLLVRIRKVTIHSEKSYTALEQLLALCSLFWPYDIDLNFFIGAFPILPDPLDSLYRANPAQFKNTLKGFGFYEISENTLQCSCMAKRILETYFKDMSRVTDKIVFGVVKRIKNVLHSLRQDYFYGTPEEILSYARPYLKRIYAEALDRARNRATKEEVDGQYPDLAKIANDLEQEQV